MCVLIVTEDAFSKAELRHAPGMQDLCVEAAKSSVTSCSGLTTGWQACSCPRAQHNQKMRHIEYLLCSALTTTSVLWIVESLRKRANCAQRLSSMIRHSLCSRWSWPSSKTGCAPANCLASVYGPVWPSAQPACLCPHGGSCLQGALKRCECQCVQAIAPLSVGAKTSCSLAGSSRHCGPEDGVPD